MKNTFYKNIEFDLEYIFKILKEIEFSLCSLHKIGSYFACREDLSEEQKISEYDKEFISFFNKSQIEERIKRCQEYLYLSITDDNLKIKFKEEAFILSQKTNYWQNQGDYSNEYFGKRNWDEEEYEDEILNFNNSLLIYNDLNYLVQSIVNIKNDYKDKYKLELIEFLHKSLLTDRLSTLRSIISEYIHLFFDSDYLEDYWESVNIPYWSKCGDFSNQIF